MTLLWSFSRLLKPDYSMSTSILFLPEAVSLFHLLTHCLLQLHHISLDDDDVLKALHCLCPYKAPGIDLMSPFPLKSCYLDLVDPITYHVWQVALYPRNGKFTRLSLSTNVEVVPK